MDKNTNIESLKIIKDIAGKIDGVGGRTFYTGECVRNEILKKPISNFNIEIYQITIEEFKALLSKYEIEKCLPNEEGLFRIKGTNITISVPMRATISCVEDAEKFIDFEMSYNESSKWKVLTINSIMKNVLSGQIIDKYNGMNDLKKGVIRHIDNSLFLENPYSVLLIAKLASELKFTVSPLTKKMSESIDISNIDKDVIRQELDKALLTTKPSLFFDNLKRCKGFDYWFKELNDLNSVHEYIHTMAVIDRASEVKERIANHIPFMIANLCHDFGKAVKKDNLKLKTIGHEIESVNLADRFLKRIGYDKQTISYVKELCLLHMEPGVLWRHNAPNKKIVALLDKTEFPEDLLLLKKCDIEGAKNASESVLKGDIPYDSWMPKSLEYYSKWLKLPHLNKDDLNKVEITQNELVERILKRARRLEYTNIFVDALRQVGIEFNIPKEKIEKIIANKKTDQETRESKFLSAYKDKGYCLDLKNGTMKEIVLAADKQIMEEFDLLGKDPDEYVKFLHEKLGELAEVHRNYITKIENSNNRDRD